MIDLWVVRFYVKRLFPVFRAVYQNAFYAPGRRVCIAGEAQLHPKGIISCLNLLRRGVVCEVVGDGIKPQGVGIRFEVSGEYAFEAKDDVAIFGCKGRREVVLLCGKFVPEPGKGLRISRGALI